MTKEEIKAEAIRIIRVECITQGIIMNEQIAYILATVAWETNHTWLPVKEAYWTSEKWRSKHLRYYPFYGRGYVQVTWKSNYEIFGKLLHVDLVEHPDLALYPKYAAYILVKGFKDGLFTGSSIDRFINEIEADYVGARQVINGNDKAETIASMALEYL